MRLQDKGVQCPTHCVSCESGQEDMTHLFFSLSFCGPSLAFCRFMVSHSEHNYNCCTGNKHDFQPGGNSSNRTETGLCSHGVEHMETSEPEGVGRQDGNCCYCCRT